MFRSLRLVPVVALSALLAGCAGAPDDSAQAPVPKAPGKAPRQTEPKTPGPGKPKPAEDYPSPVKPAKGYPSPVAPKAKQDEDYPSPVAPKAKPAEDYPSPVKPAEDYPSPVAPEAKPEPSSMPTPQPDPAPEQPDSPAPVQAAEPKVLIFSFKTQQQPFQNSGEIMSLISCRNANRLRSKVDDSAWKTKRCPVDQAWTALGATPNPNAAHLVVIQAFQVSGSGKVVARGEQQGFRFAPK